MIIVNTSKYIFVRRSTILYCVNISATILLGAPGSTIAACSGCPNGSTWEVQAAISNGLNVEIASDFVRFDGMLAIHDTHHCIVAPKLHTSTSCTIYGKPAIYYLKLR